MKKLILILLVLFYSHCSFDNKSGIWTNDNKADVKKNNRFKKNGKMNFIKNQIT